MLPIQIQSAATVRLSGCVCSVDGDCLVNLALAVLVLCNQIQQTLTSNTSVQIKKPVNAVQTYYVHGPKVSQTSPAKFGVFNSILRLHLRQVTYTPWTFAEGEHQAMCSPHSGHNIQRRSWG